MPKENPKKTVSAPKAKSKSRLLLGIVLVAVGLLIIFRVGTTESEKNRVVIAEKTIYVDIADENDEITKGLGGRGSLKSDHGMLFVFQTPLTPGFWMKDMQFPIDVVWIDENQEIIAITPSLPVESFPDSVSPPSPVKYVLEVNAGLSAFSGWLAGDKVELYLQ